MFDFRGLIDAILRRKSDDPVGDLKSATVWVQELPLADVHRAQVEIVKALTSLNENRRMSLKERVRVVMYLDEKARGLQSQLCRDYLAAIDSPNAPERAYLATILTFWEEIASAYQLCIKTFAQEPVAKLWPRIQIITARGLYVLGQQAKWAALRYLPREPIVWRNLNRLYRFAEREGFEKTAVRLYPEHGEDTTASSEYARAQLLELAGPESLTPAQIDQVDGWLAQWARTVTIEADFRPHRQLYAINLAEARPARRLRRNMLGEKYRYFGVGLLLITIDKVLEQLKAGEIPARLGLGEDCRLPQCMELIELVQRRWARKDVARRHERQAQMKVVDVAIGFHDVATALHTGRRSRAERGELIEYRVMGHTVGGTPLGQPTGEAELFEPKLERWLMENESTSGIGATLETSGAPLKIGTLVGLRPDSRKHFLIGVVRRMQRNPSARAYVGIETLSQTPIPVLLASRADGNATPLTSRGIYLAEMAEAGVPRSLLLAREEYRPGKLLRLSAQGKAYTIRLQRPFAMGEDYVRVGFDVLARHHH